MNRIATRAATGTATARSTIVALVVLFALLVAACTSGSDSDVVQSDDRETETTSGSSSDEEPDDGQEAEDPGTAAGFDGPVTVVVPNSPGTLSSSGRQRVMAALVGNGPNAFLGGPDQPVTVRFEPVNEGEGGDVAGVWLTTNAAALGLYVSYFDFPTAGPWEVIVLDGEQELGRALVEVVEDSIVPKLGEPAPPSESLTGLTVEAIAEISTDADPDPDLYDLSIADAVNNGRPTVVAFATPAFCQTALCGPTLETVKAAAAGRDDIDVVHVEPFDLELAPQGILEPIPTMFEWGLVTEPWVFLIDADGLVAATFEGIIGQAELEAAVDAL